MMRISLLLRAFVLVLGLLPAVTLPQSGELAPSAADMDEPAATYWLRNREGWFWYQDPPQQARKPDPKPLDPARPAELAEFDAMQKRLDELKRVSVMNPSDQNMLAYMRYQRFVMDKSEVFAGRWQRLVWSIPELDYGLTGRPTNSTAIVAYDEQQRDRQAQLVRGLAATHGLIFIFRSDCPFCHRFAPILKRFQEEFGMTVFAVSLDGGGLPDFPNAPMDNGIAARLRASVVPALYLTTPSNRQIRPVGFGVMAMTDLIERIAALAQDMRESPVALSGSSQ